MWVPGGQYFTVSREHGYTTGTGGAWDCSWKTGKKLTEVNLSGPVPGVEARPQITYISFSRWRHGRDPAWRAVKRRHRVFGNIERVQSYDPAVKLPRSKFPRDRSPRHSPPPSTLAGSCRRESKEYSDGGVKDAQD